MVVREEQGPASHRPGCSRRGRLGVMLSLVVSAPPLSALLAGAACGGRVLILVPYGDDGGAPVSDDASAGTASGSSGSSSETSSNGGSSSGSSGGTMSSQEAAVASSDGSGGPFVGNAICTSAADCPAGRICCATENLVTSCLEGPCPARQPLQFCATSTECVVKTDTCILLLSEPEDSYMVCTPPPASSR